VTGRILQVNISRGGLPKRAIADGNLTVDGIDGDSWAHPEIHGGRSKAVLLIAFETIEALRANGFPVYPGALGENLTTEGLDPARWRMGQQYVAGEAIIELTTIRVPCSSLNVYGPAIQTEIYDGNVNVGDSNSPRWALSGFYARVVRPGLVFPGNVISLLSEVA
jgi:MOSC domain-containing protein YiiM